MNEQRLLVLAGLLAVSTLPAAAADHLQLNPRLDYSSDSQDGPLITGEHMDGGLVKEEATYIIIYQEGCFNSKHQAQRTVELYGRYKDRVNFVVIDLDRSPTPEQMSLVHEHYRNYIPHVTVLDKKGKALYDQAGEIDSSRLAALLDKAAQ